MMKLICYLLICRLPFILRRLRLSRQLRWHRLHRSPCIWQETLRLPLATRQKTTLRVRCFHLRCFPLPRTSTPIRRKQEGTMHQWVRWVRGSLRKAATKRYRNYIRRTLKEMPPLLSVHYRLDPTCSPSSDLSINSPETVFVVFWTIRFDDSLERQSVFLEKRFEFWSGVSDS